MIQKQKNKVFKHNLPTKAGLIQDLHDIARSLGRTPTLRELRQAGVKGRTYHVNVYMRVFGTFANALRAAGLPSNVRQEFTREELLKQLRNLSKSLKRKLKRADVLKASQNHICARLSTFIKEFGSITKAFEEAGVGTTIKRPDKKEMLQALRDLTKTLDRIPGKTDVHKAWKKKKCPSYNSYQKHFGGLLPAIREAGLGNHQAGYTEQEMLKCLRDLADELGRPPLHSDIAERSGKGLMPGITSYHRHFGGIAAARKRAGIKSPSKTESELLSDLRQLARTLGHTPSAREMKEAYRKGALKSLDIYRKVFGNLAEARNRAGLVPYQSTYKPPARDKKEVILQLQQLAKKLGHSPTASELDAANKRGECLGISSLAHIFGSRAEAYRLAGIPLKKIKRRYSREELIDQLQRLAKHLGRTPKAVDLLTAPKEGECASLGVYQRIFGNFPEAIKAAGLKPSEPKPKGRIKYTRERLIEDLRKLARKLRCLPTETHIIEANKRGECATARVYCLRFGGLPNARREAGLGDLSRSIYTRERLVKDLKRLYRKIKRPPVERDIEAASKNGECAGSTTYYKCFGSIQKAREAAGLDKTVSRSHRYPVI